MPSNDSNSGAGNDNNGGVGAEDLPIMVAVALFDARLALECVTMGLTMMEKRQMSEPIHSEIGVLAKFAGQAAEAYERLVLICDEAFRFRKLT